MNPPAAPGDTSSRPCDNGSIPGYQGPLNPKLVVVGERWDNETVPFTGKSGENFRRALERAEIKPARCGFCWDSDELEPFLERLQPGWIAVSGDRALQHLRPDLACSTAHGRPFALTGDLHGPVCMPVYSHVALYRQPKILPTVITDLLKLREMAKDPGGWLHHTGDTCYRCGGEFHRIDDQGVIWCAQHWELRTADGLELLRHAFNLDYSGAASSIVDRSAC